MAHARSRPITLEDSGLLAIGFLALAGAVLAAHTSPATGYELSLYSGTPLAFWLLFGCAVSIALAVGFRAATVWSRRIALVLTGVSVAVFVGLPILRGYRFYGAGDALTHLGWIRGINWGTFEPLELRYPAIHTVSNLISVTLGIDLAQASLLLIVLLSCLFAIFVALATSVLFESRFSAVAGAFGAFLLLPITNLSTFIVLHAMTQAILFSSVSVYLLLKYVRNDPSSEALSGVGWLLAITSVAMVVYHPQLAAHFLVMFFGIVAVQYLYRRYRPDHPIAEHRSVFGQSVVLLAAFLVWIANHGFFGDVVGYAVSSAASYFFGGGDAASAVDSQGSSLSEIGVTILEMVVKLFGPSLVFGLLASLLVLAALLNDDLTRRTDGVLPYFVVSMIGLAGVFGLYFFGSYSAMYFRVFGLMMLLTTIAGAAAIAYGMQSVSGNYSMTAVYSVVVVGFGAVLLLSLLVVYPSPFIYQASPHVTDASLEGHETMFEHNDEELPFVGIRSGPHRYEDVTHAKYDRTLMYPAVSGEEIEEGISRQYESDRYLTVTQSDREREVVSYKELRYTEGQLESISSQPGVNRVQSNGEFELYYVHGTANGSSDD